MPKIALSYPPVKPFMGDIYSVTSVPLILGCDSLGHNSPLDSLTSKEATLEQFYHDALEPKALHLVSTTDP